MLKIKYVCIYTCICQIYTFLINFPLKNAQRAFKSLLKHYLIA